ncbi:shikimate dehydrogenase [Uruburuella testudinis]|uniref:Shikimate dehydrogenase n=1 Tax=Uruburuella testudinis TaxID=1282863 RepID=A0ABY4DVA9_9NEIS|nr:shikimate dehydrogenase [Uruburuella testudinis]UOO82605.1 shikimate dehydrogenase [Uruburuella testudinis]
MPMINGLTRVIAHIGYPTQTFKSPMIYNPYFQQAGINAVVVPFACQSSNYPAFLRAVFGNLNTAGALITMPHKVSTLNLVDRASATAQIAGACNAVRLGADGRLEGDMFDGEGFVRGIRRKGFDAAGKSALVIGCGGVGSAIAASLAAAGAGSLMLFDNRNGTAAALAGRLKQHYPALQVQHGHNDVAGFDLVVNATPLGMYAGDALPTDVSHLSPHTFVGEVVLQEEMTPFLRAAAAIGCRLQVGTDMLFEQIPAYLEYFNLPTTTPETLRRLATL